MSFLDHLFPRECVGCKKEGAYLCPECRKTLVPHPEICPFCHHPSQGFKTCSSCRESQVLEGIFIGFRYQSLLKKIIFKLKFYHKSDVVDFLVQRLAWLVETSLPLSIDSNHLIISFVPSHRRRKYLEKGYNQSELLANALAKTLHLPILPVAKKTKYTLSQLHFGREERKKNLKDVFIPLDLRDIPQGKTILIVDDVTTTGSTLEELASSIQKIRPDLAFRGVVLARHLD